MKTVFFISFGLLLSMTANASMSFKDVSAIAAEAVVASKKGKQVESCSDVKGKKKLIACVIENTNVSLDLHLILEKKPNKKLKGTVELGYYDDSGDCHLTATVDTTNGDATVGDWDCD